MFWLISTCVGVITGCSWYWKWESYEMKRRGETYFEEMIDGKEERNEGAKKKTRKTKVSHKEKWGRGETT